MTGTTIGGGGGKSGEGWQHGAMGTIGASYNGTVGGAQDTAGPHRKSRNRSRGDNCAAKEKQQTTK